MKRCAGSLGLIFLSVAESGSSVAGTYRCWSYNVSGGGGLSPLGRVFLQRSGKP